MTPDVSEPRPRNAVAARSCCARVRGALAPVWPIVALYLLGLLVFSLFRGLLCVHCLTRIVPVDSWYRVFPIGLRMDTILLCYVLAAPLACLLLLPARAVRICVRLLPLYAALLGAVAVFLELASFPFMAEFDTRPDRLFIEYLGHWREVSGMIWQGYRTQLLTALAATGMSALTLYLLIGRICRRYVPAGITRRLLLCAVCAPLIFLGARSSISHRPANISTAAFSSSHLVNQLGLNSCYSVAYAWRNQNVHEDDPARRYGSMPVDEMLRRVDVYRTATADNAPRAFSQTPSQRPRNLVIILEESLGAEYVGCLGGMPLTPHFDRLSNEGLLLTSLYATGTRTVRGIEATVCGFLPTPGRSVVKLGLSQHRFFTLADLLQQQSYCTEFIYGGDSQFDNMRAFFLGNGFQQVHDLKTFRHPVFEGTWGVSDEDLFTKANKIFAAHDEKPFFALVLSTSNHDPFEFPDGRIDLYEQPKMTRHNAIQYADHALGRFFAMARKERYYDHTVFLVIADHSTRLRGQDLIPIEKFHIPGLIIGPGVTPGTYDRVASQIDMPPTLLDLMGLGLQTPLVGRSLLRVAQGTPGRAVMQYGTTHAFMVGAQLVIQRPNMPPVQARVEQGQLTLTALDPELARDALAHALLPGYLYRNQLYCMAEDGEPARDLLHVTMVPPVSGVAGR